MFSFSGPTRTQIPQSSADLVVEHIRQDPETRWLAPWTWSFFGDLIDF